MCSSVKNVYCCLPFSDYSVFSESKCQKILRIQNLFFIFLLLRVYPRKVGRVYVAKAGLGIRSLAFRVNRSFIRGERATRAHRSHPSFQKSDESD